MVFGPGHLEGISDRGGCFKYLGPKRARLSDPRPGRDSTRHSLGHQTPRPGRAADDYTSQDPPRPRGQGRGAPITHHQCPNAPRLRTQRQSPRASEGLHCRRPSAASPARAEALLSRTTTARMPGTCVRSARARGPGTTTLSRTTLWPTHYNSQNAPRPFQNPVGLNYDSHNAPRPEPDTKTPPSDLLRNPNGLTAGPKLPRQTTSVGSCSKRNSRVKG